MATRAKVGVVFSALVLATACTSNAQRPPADVPYVTPNDVDVTQLLPPPPPMDSLLQERDVAAVRVTHGRSTPEEMQRAEADISVNVFHFADVLGPQFTAERLPLTSRFFGKVTRDIGPFLSLTKACWRRRRPFVVDPSIAPTAALIASTAERPSAGRNPVPLRFGPACVAGEEEIGRKVSYSYPSGHAAVGAITAILLAEMVPERRSELFARGWEYGAARVTGGVHFPTDVESGRLLATSLVTLMLNNERFRSDLQAVRAELRAALGL
jgi:acid phosphatase (class A)